MDAKNSVKVSDGSDHSPRSCRVQIASSEHTPFDFWRIVFEGFIAGGAAGVVVEAALYPIDTIKTRLQARTRMTRFASKQTVWLGQLDVLNYWSLNFGWFIWRAAHGGGKIILRGLYSGLGGNLVRVLPASALFLGVYEPTKQKLLNILPENLSAIAHLTAGALGGAASSLVRVPTEVVKQRMQIGHFSSALNAVRLIAANEGVRGFYAGYGSFLLRDLPFDAIQFCIYEQLRIGYKLAANRDLKDAENAMIGAFSGAITGAITTPLDVIKTRLMVQGTKSQYKGSINCVRRIIEEEGSSALMKGVGPRVLWIGIGGSIFFGVLERAKQILAGRRADLNKE